MTQKELAEIIGIQEQQIQRYEANHYSSASFDRLQEIATALNIEIVQAVMERRTDAETRQTRPSAGFMKGSGKILGDIITPVEQPWEVLQ
jgi:transcriptional regulator with XRE-family HTH domain